MGSFLLIGIVLALATTLPPAWKWQLGVARTAAAVTAIGLLCGVIVVLLDGVVEIGGVVAAILVWGLTVAVALALLLYRFYRDPERRPPDGEGLILSPADGQVIYVQDAAGGMLPVTRKLGRAYPLEELTRTPLRRQDAVVVGIAMSFLDVHVNRAPIEGKVVLQRHHRGSFGSLKRPEMAFENERTTTLIERDDLQVAVVQIASRLVRQISSFVREGEHASVGQRIGVIRFGSQVDLVLPMQPGLRVTVRPGQRVRAGQSVIAVVTLQDRGPSTWQHRSGGAVNDAKPGGHRGRA
jgi:phosphatidylserine decarboxylase